MAHENLGLGGVDGGGSANGFGVTSFHTTSGCPFTPAAIAPLLLVS